MNQHEHFNMGVHVGPAEDTTAPPPAIIPAPVPSPVLPMAPSSTAAEVATVAQSLRDAITRANTLVPEMAAAVAEFHTKLDNIEARTSQLKQLNKQLQDLEPT
jgi:hypothetical protein